MSEDSSNRKPPKPEIQDSMSLKIQKMEQYKKMDRNKLLLSPSGGKQQTNLGFGAVTSTDNDDTASDYNYTTT